MTKDFSSKTMVVKRQGNKTSLKICKELPTQNSKSSKNFFKDEGKDILRIRKKLIISTTALKNMLECSPDKGEMTLR